MNRFANAVAALLLLLPAGSLRAEQLVARMFSTLDGLADNTRLGDMLQDSHGFIWIATQGGVSRFDGQQFQNFSVHDGLGYPLVNKICETRDGRIWVATNGGGVARYDPFGPPGRRFVTYPTGSTQESNSVNSVREGPDGAIWAATEAGMFRLEKGSLKFQPVVPLPVTNFDDVLIDPGHSLWAATGSQGLYRLNADGSLDNWGTREGIPLHLGRLYRDHSGAIWLVSVRGALQIDPQAKPRRSPILRRLEPTPGNRSLFDMLQDARGDYWISGAGGLYHSDGRTVRTLGQREGVPGALTWGLMEDREGNLWVGVEGAGVLRIVRYRFSAWSVEDGLANPTVLEAFQAVGSGVTVVTWGSAGLRIQRLRDGTFQDVAPPIPVSARVDGNPVLGDHLGDLWVTRARGIDRYRSGRMIQHLTLRNPAGTAYETRVGDVWFAGWDVAPVLVRWKRATNRLESFAGVPGPADLSPWAMREDAAGNLWIACVRAGLFRYRNGQFAAVPSPFPPAGRFKIFSLHVDDSGQTWIGYTRGALAVVDAPNEPQPRIRKVDWGAGTVQSPILSLTSDRYGRLYIGSATGLWMFDPRSGRSLAFAGTVPMLGGAIYCGRRDEAGDLWFGTDRGLVRFSPAGDPFPASPSVRFTQVRLADGLYPISGWGEDSVHAPRFPDWQNRFEFSFSGLAEAGPLRYRYRLEPRDGDWTATREQTVIYRQLPSGAYRFRVQSVDPAGRTSAREAFFSFEIAPHIWQRWWFLTLAALVFASAVYGLYRFRLHQLLEVERVRMRIATDLHDDIGSALSHITLLSEVARRQAAGETVPEALSRIAAVSRETAASMADIVWAINPQRDSLGDLSVRIRRFASELFGARDIGCIVVTPESDESLKLSVDVRRQLLLIAKEAIHNAVRHAQSTQVSIELKQERHAVVFRIQDDGKGFDPAATADGHGIASMRARAARLRGTLLIQSGEGRGTNLEFRIPI